MRRLVTGLAAATTTIVLGAMVACGGGERPAAEENQVVQNDGGSKTDADISTGSGVVFDIDVQKGIVFGDEGLVSCGTQAAERTVTLKNTSSSILNYKIELTAGNDYYKVTPSDGGIPAGATATIKVTPNPIPAESEVTPDLYAGTLEVKFPNLTVPPTIIRLHQTARGAIITTSASDEIDLGQVQVGKSNAVPITLSNAGNAEATATMKVGTSVFSIGGGATALVKVPGGGSESREIKLAPTSAGDLTDTLTLSYGSAVFCKPPPTTYALKGAGSTSVGISKTTVDFGLVNCNSTANAQPIRISSSIAMTFTAALTKGGLSPYTLANDADGSTVDAADQISIAAASEYLLRIVPKKIPQVSVTTDNAFGDALTITTSVPGDVPHVINLKETAQGAILAFDRSDVIVSGPVGTNINTNFALQNKGNVEVPYVISTNPNATFTSTLTSGNAVKGDTKGVLISKAPTTTGQIVNGTMSVALGPAGGVLCADLPPAMPLQVTGTGSAISINPTNLNFGSVDCGQTAPFQTITLSSTVATKIKLNLGAGPSSPYSLADSAGGALALNTEVNVSPGNPYTLRVVPKTVPVPSATTANGLGDTLTLTSDIPSEPVRTAPLTQTAHGAIFVVPAKVEYANGANGTFTVKNTGNATGSYHLVVSGPNVSNAGSSIILLPSSEQGYAVNGPSGTVEVVPESGFPLCASPADMTVTQLPP